MAKKKKSSYNKKEKSGSQPKATSKVVKKEVSQKVPQAKDVVETGFWLKNSLAALVILVLGVLIYSQSLNFEYVLDDKIVFTKNSYVKKGFDGFRDILFSESMKGHFGEQRDLVVGGRYRPLSLLTFATEYALFADPANALNKERPPGLKELECPECNPWISHFINILLYGLTGLLLFRVLALMFPRSEKTPWFLGFAFIAALLWVVHPVHSEVVANVKGRDEILCLMGALATMYCCWKFVQNNNPIWLILAAPVFFLSLLAKENALTFLAVIPLSLYFFRQKPDFKKLGAILLVLLIVSIAYLRLRTHAVGFLLSSGKEIKDLMNNPFYGLGFNEKFATIFYTLGEYIKLTFFPHPLTHDYYPYHVPVMSWSNPISLLSLLAHMAGGLFALWSLKTKNLIGFAIILYLATLSIVSNVPFTVGTFMNERFIFIPTIGTCLVLAYFLTRFLGNWKAGKFKILGMVAVGIFVLGFSLKTVWRVPAWQNHLTLNQAAIKVSPNSARANCFMGTAFFEEYRVTNEPTRKQELLDKASFHVGKALKIHPRYGSALTMQSGVVVEEFKTHKDLDRLLNDFYNLLVIKKNLTFIDEYIEYLLPRQDAQKMSAFLYRIGYQYFYKQAGDQVAARKYINYALQAEPNNSRLKQAKAEIN